FILFAIIVVLTLAQRIILRDSSDKERLDRPLAALLRADRSSADRGSTATRGSTK
ncbi:MAG: hypothetical protein JWO01_475, partial [Microbacteriaceae bacterium]|nr:hypothetical protein [Microbacteriaceae bacterium]